MRSALLLLLGALAAAAVGAVEAATDATPSFRIYTREAGLHRVTFEELHEAGLPSGAPSRELSLENRGRTVPLHLADGGDGLFGPGDSFIFIAEVLSGETTFHHPYARHNVYRLRWDSARARRLPEGDRGAAIEAATATPLSRRVHHEKDALLIRLAASEVSDAREPELWYWAKVTSHRDSTPFELSLDLTDASREEPVVLKIGLRGLSTLPKEHRRQNNADHHVTLLADGDAIGSSVWSGRREHLFTKARWFLEEGVTEPTVQLEITRRRIDDKKVVDVVMIDYLNLHYRHNGKVGGEPVELHLPPGFTGGAAELLPDTSGELLVVGRELGLRRIEAVVGEAVRLGLPARERSFWVAPSGAIASPVAVEEDAPSELRRYDRQADYVVIAHASLLEASRELVDLHRESGLTVDLVDVQDVYDEFGDGIVSPRAIRDFLAHAYHNWAPPRLRYVLLIGDASWDTKNSTVDEANYANWVGQQLLRGDRFVAKDTEDYDAARRNDRNLIPSWNYHTAEGHAASDAYYASVDGDDDLPDLALGRLPVTTPEAVAEITGKIRRYMESAPLGPWRSRVVWISGALQSHQLRTNLMAQELSAEGRSSTVILPGDTATTEDRQRIVDAIDGGNLVTHFIGHGGRFIWRTGPPDLADQVDLFGLEDLERLQNDAMLPVVLSVSCYSAPFDHPSADSIGEAFLRLPDRGAIAFIGASWRNSPPVALSRWLVEELSRPGTVGEALTRVKRRIDRPDVTHLFNLLGDPAVPLAAPQHSIGIGYRREAAELVVDFEVPSEAVGGRVAVQYLDAEGVPLTTSEVVAHKPRVSVRSEADPDVRTVAVYFWNEATGVDGVGAARVAEPESIAAGS